MVFVFLIYANNLFNIISYVIIKILTILHNYTWGVRQMASETTTYQQRAYEYIKAQIINRVFQPRQYITDTEIADRLNISRTPVREAFLRLENENLLVYESRRGWRVYALSLEDIHEIFDLKEVIEGMTARQAATCQDEALRAALQHAWEGMREAAESGDTESWVKADFLFHDIIFTMAGNERARRVIYNLNDQWNRVRVGFTTIQSRIDRSIAEHKAIMDSILSGDGEQAEREVYAHFKDLRQELVHLLVNMVLPFAKDGV